MPEAAPSNANGFIHRDLDCGAEFAADLLPHRDTVAMSFRMLTGLANDPPELTGIGSIVERTLSKGTRKYDGRGLADAFDAMGVQWGSISGRQSTLVRILCLPEFALQTVNLVAEMLCRPTFPEDACKVAVDLARQDLRSMEDDPHDLLRVMIQRLTLGPIFGRHPGGEPETLARITPQNIAEHWKRFYHTGRLQVSVAGPVDADALIQRIGDNFADFGSAQRAGREPADFDFEPTTQHRDKDLKQQYIAFTLLGAKRADHHFAVERVLIAVLSGGMSGRLFTEVREKLGLVYWVAAWHEQPRDAGLIYFGASTTPQRCEKTYATLRRELDRLSEDLTAEETHRARNSLIAQLETEDDLTRARAGSLSDDLFHFSRPIGLAAKLAALRAVTVERVQEYARGLPRDRLCVATLGPLAPGTKADPSPSEA